MLNKVCDCFFSEEIFEKVWYTVFAPGDVLEEVAFNPIKQAENDKIRRITARVTAVTAPILFLYQGIISGGVGTVSGCLGGESSSSFKNHSVTSLKSGFSSLLEIPSKLWYGERSQANYLKIPFRYEKGEPSFFYREIIKQNSSI